MTLRSQDVEALSIVGLLAAVWLFSLYADRKVQGYLAAGKKLDEESGEE